MPYGWTAEELRAAEARCEAEVADMRARGFDAKQVESRVKSLETLKRWRENAERRERG